MMLRRINKDIKSLMINGFDVETIGNDIKTIYTHIDGPKGTIYETGKWKIKIEFVENYPFTSPSISFSTPIFHPNVEFVTGAICLDVLNTNWTPSYEIFNVVSLLIPQLLSYPNPDDPFNLTAANLLKFNKPLFDSKVLVNIKTYCHE